MSTFKTTKSSAWAACFFAASLAKTLLLTPFMLWHLGAKGFAFWSVLLSVRAVLFFIPDAYVRFLGNEYNLRFHAGAPATPLLRSGGRFLFAVVCLLLLPVALLLLTGAGSRFPVSDMLAQTKVLGLSATCLLAASAVQVGQRLWGAAAEARGKVVMNFQFEVVLALAEILLVSGLLFCRQSLATVVFADAALIALASSAYILMMQKIVGPKQAAEENFAEGKKMFFAGKRLYAGNFLEKAAGDGLPMLLSLFRFSAPAIALFGAFRTIANTPILAQSMLQAALSPKLQQDVANKNFTAAKHLLQRLRLAFGLFLAVGVVVCVPFYETVFLWWTKGRLPFEKDVLLLLLAGTLMRLSTNANLFVFKALNVQKPFLRLTFLQFVAYITAMFCCTGNLKLFCLYAAVWEMLFASLFVPAALHLETRRHWPGFAEKPYLQAIPFVFGALFLIYLACAQF